MVDIFEIQAAYYMVAATGVLIAAVYCVLNIRATLQTRQAQLFMSIYSTHYSDDFTRARSEIFKWTYKDYDDYMTKYGYDVNPEASIMYSKVNGYLEGIGVLVRRRLMTRRSWTT